MFQMNVAIITGYLFTPMAALIILSNWYHAIYVFISKESTSFTLLFGGVLGTIGILLCNIPNFYFWIPLLADFTIPLIIYTSIKKAKN